MQIIWKHIYKDNFRKTSQYEQQRKSMVIRFISNTMISTNETQSKNQYIINIGTIQ